MVPGENPGQAQPLALMKHPGLHPTLTTNNQGEIMTNPYETKKMSTGKKVGIGVAAFFGIALLANACDTSKPAESSNLGVLTQTTTGTTTPATTTITTPAGPKTSFAGGIFLVGTQIEAGTYQAPGGSNCYYERRANTSSDFEGIIANEWSTDKSQQIVTIDPTDRAFKSQGCGMWTKIG